MKAQRSRVKGHVVIIMLIFYSFAACNLLLATVVSASEKWKGIDESVVKKFAKEHGREAKDPLINTDQGDLLLFVFLLAGAAGGFAAGYYWHVLITTKGSRNTTEDPDLSAPKDK